MGDGPSVAGCSTKYMSQHDIDSEHERKTKNIAMRLHKGQAFRSVGGMDAKERRKYELSSNCHNQPSAYPLANFNFRPEQRSMWIDNKNFII